MNQIAIKDIIDRKRKNGKKIVVLTAYDFPFAKLVDQAGVDIVLVGDSVGMVCLGYDSTVPVTMRDMLYHVKAVSRAVKHALIVADMPFGSYDTVERTLRNAKRLIQKCGQVGRRKFRFRSSQSTRRKRMPGHGTCRNDTSDSQSIGRV